MTTKLTDNFFGAGEFVAKSADFQVTPHLKRHQDFT